ncbi:MAG: 2-C-methyl-D-erythritol 4-phosphate cytidylyltransferase [Phycisphaerales bacterium]|nr:2-C-methyl-D-erythritol 4-phosphate cytidylyltransferase [Phycisphaerales bacterium]
MRLAVIFPAAGKSERFGERDKLSEDLGGRPLLMRTIDLFAKRDEMIFGVVAAPPDTFDQFKFRYGDGLALQGVTCVPGGRVDRWETVKNALDVIPDDCTHIAVHDAARPCTPPELISHVLRAAEHLPAVVPAMRIASTLKRVGEETEVDESDDPIAAILGDADTHKLKTSTVIETVDRTGLVEVQTPQVFHADVLRRAYAQDDLSSTDDASLIERLGDVPVHVVPGDPRNIKITTPADIPLARAILGVRGPQGRAIHKRF